MFIQFHWFYQLGMFVNSETSLSFFNPAFFIPFHVNTPPLPCPAPRLALQHGDGHVVDYLSQPVIDYILQTQLYITASG